MSAYVPPHRRGQPSISDPPASAATDAEVGSPPAVTAAATAPRSLQTLVDTTPAPPPESSRRRGLHVTAIMKHFLNEGVSPRHSTLNASDERPEEVAFILVFPTGHPRWDAERTLYAKTGLALLPEYGERKQEFVGGEESKAEDEDGGLRCVETGVRQLGLVEKENSNAGDVTSSQANHTNGADSSIGEHSPIGQSLDTAPASNPQFPEEIIDATPPTQPNLRDIQPICYAPSTKAPIAVFETELRDKGGFLFIGWHTISQISLLAPHSVAIGKMMEDKWSQTAAVDEDHDRDMTGHGRRGLQDVARPRNAWVTDLDREWAAVTLAKMDPEAEDYPAEPVIEASRGGRGGSNQYWGQRGGYRGENQRGRGGQRREWRGRGQPFSSYGLRRQSQTSQREDYGTEESIGDIETGNTAGW